MIDLKSSCDAYRREADRLLEVIGRIRQMQAAQKIALGFDAATLDKLEARVLKFRLNDCDPHFRIAFVGGYNAGKSELINAFLGGSVLPAANRDTTFVPTIVGASLNGKRTNKLQFLTEVEVSDILREYQSMSEDKGWPVSTRAVTGTPLAELKRLVESLKAGNRLKQGEDTDLCGLFGALKNPELRPFIVEGDRRAERPVSEEEILGLVIRDSQQPERYLASSLAIQLSNWPLPGDVQLIDLPGTDAADRWAKKVTHRYVQEVDAMVLVGVNDGVYGDAAMDLFDAIRSWEGDHAQRLFVVINKADRYGGLPAKDILSAYQSLIEKLAAAMPGVKPRISYTSAAAAQSTCEAHKGALADLPNIPQTGNPEVDAMLSALKANGGVQHLIDELVDFLRTRAASVKLGAIAARWQSIRLSINTVLAAKGQQARSWLTAHQDMQSSRHVDSLKRLRQQVEAAVAASKEEPRTIRERLASGLSEKLAGDLKTAAAGLCAEAIADGDSRAKASVVAPRVWLAAYERLREVAFDKVRQMLLDELLASSRERINPLVGKLDGIGQPQGISGINLRIPVNPIARITETVELRLFEILPPPADVPCPYPEMTPNQLFGDREAKGSYANRFVASVETLFDRRIQDLVSSLSRFLHLHVDFHLDEFQRQAEMFTTAAAGFDPTSLPGLNTLESNTDGQQLYEQNRQIADLAAAFEQVSASPAPGVSSRLAAAPPTAAMRSS